MNTAILVPSFRFQTQRFDLIVSLATWINNLLVEIKTDDYTFRRSLKNEDYEAVKIIVPFIKDTTPYYLPSTIAKHTDLLELILSKYEMINIYCFYRIIHEACEQGYIDTVKLMIKLDYKFDNGHILHLLSVVKARNVEDVHLLLDHAYLSKI